MTSYSVVLCVALATGLSYCDRVNLSVAIVAIAQELGWTSADKARVLGSFFWGYLLSQTLGATLAQRYGGKLVLGVAACFWSVLTLAVPLLARHSVNALVLGRVVLGVFEGVTFPAAYYLLRQFVHESARSRAIALVSIGTLSGAVLSFVTCPLLVQRMGWESVFYAFGGVLGPVFVCGWFALVPNTPVYVAAQVDAVERGGEEEVEEVEEALAPAVTASPVPPPASYLSMIQQREVFAICFAHFTHNLCHFALISWLPSFLSDSLGFEGDSLAVSSLPWIIMGVSVGLSSLLADRVIASSASSCSVRRVITVSAFVCAGTSLVVLGLLPAHGVSRWASLALLTLAMAANGTSSAAGYEASKLDLTRTPAAASRLQSLSNTIATLGGVFGVPLVNVLKGDEAEDWSRVFMGLGLAFYLAACVFHVLGRWSSPTVA